MLAINGLFVAAGSIVLIAWMDSSSFMALQIGYALTGLGMGPIFANTLLWLEENLECGVSGKVASVLNLSGCLGVNVAPLIIGRIIDNEPRIIVFLQSAVLLFSALIYAFVEMYGSRKAKKSVFDVKQDEDVKDYVAVSLIQHKK